MYSNSWQAAYLPTWVRHCSLLLLVDSKSIHALYDSVDSCTASKRWTYAVRKWNGKCFFTGLSSRSVTTGNWEVSMIVQNAMGYVMCMCTSLTLSLVSPRIGLDIVCSNISYFYGYNEETLQFNLSTPF